MSTTDQCGPSGTASVDNFIYSVARLTTQCEGSPDVTRPGISEGDYP